MVDVFQVDCQLLFNFRASARLSSSRLVHAKMHSAREKHAYADCRSMHAAGRGQPMRGDFLGRVNSSWPMASRSKLQLLTTSRIKPLREMWLPKATWKRQEEVRRSFPLPPLGNPKSVDFKRPESQQRREAVCLQSSSSKSHALC